MIVTN